MPIYKFRCDCGRTEEVFELTYKDLRDPICCDRDMDRDYRAEGFKGVTNREKGTEYATGFVETFENKEAGRHEQVFIKSREHHMQELRRRGLQQKGPQSQEAVYRRKHNGDFVSDQARAKRGQQ